MKARRQQHQPDPGANFTAEGSPPPGLVATERPVLPKPARGNRPKGSPSKASATANAPRNSAPLIAGAIITPKDSP